MGKGGVRALGTPPFPLVMRRSPLFWPAWGPWCLRTWGHGEVAGDSQALRPSQGTRSHTAPSLWQDWGGAGLSPCPQPVMGISSVCPDAALTPSPNKGGACRAWNRQRMCRDMGSGRGTGADGSRRGCRCFCLAWARSSHRCPCSWGVGSCQLPVDHSWVLCP